MQLRIFAMIRNRMFRRDGRTLSPSGLFIGLRRLSCPAVRTETGTAAAAVPEDKITEK